MTDHEKRIRGAFDSPCTKVCVHPHKEWSK